VDDALREAWRRAAADPRDLAARAAYARQLERAGHHAAACHEQTVAAQARAWAASRWERPVAPRPGDPPVLVGGARVDLAPFDPRAVAPPEVPDTRWPGARLVLDGGEVVPLVLVPWPACPGGCVRGALECPECGGQGVVREFTGRAEDAFECAGCEGLGATTCPLCDGAGIAPPPRSAPPGCEHALGTPEWTGAQGRTAPWALLRCERCGLGALRPVDPPDDEPSWACPGCGRFVCACGPSPT
jgi:hypothetical protein